MNKFRQSKYLLLAVASVMVLSVYATPRTTYAVDTCPSGSTAQETDTQTFCLDTNDHLVGTIAKTGADVGIFKANETPEATQNSIPGIPECQNMGFWGTGLVNALNCAALQIEIQIFSGIISGFRYVVYFADSAFNAAIQYTVLDFNGWFQPMQESITTGWTVFRDLSNILIIGFFVFIAISIILGLQEYGQRKLIARVIIVAILINFSFLFTLITINASNAIATGIYNQMGINATANNDSLRGLGDQFLTVLKISSFQETTDTLKTVYAQSNQDFPRLLWYVLLSGVFSLMVIGTFLFGAFLLVARFITLILLLILSAAAFATYLIPAFAEAGWSKWWLELLRNAFLAPVMMLFLAISLGIAKGIAPQGAGQSFGTLAANPADTTTWGLVMMFLIVIGVLFGGMYIASQMAGGLAKRMVSFAPANALAAAGRVAGFTGRRWLGAGADARATYLSTQVQNEAARLAQNRDWNTKNASLITSDPTKRKPDGTQRSELSSLTNLMRQQAKAQKQAKNSYEVANNKVISEALKSAGAVGALANPNKTSFHDTAHAAATEAAKQAVQQIGLSKGKAEELARGAPSQERDEYNAAEQLLEQMKANAEEARNSNTILREIKQQEENRDTGLRAIVDINKEFETGAITQEQRAIKLDSQSRLIRQAQQEAYQLRQRVANAQEGKGGEEGKQYFEAKKILSSTEDARKMRDEKKKKLEEFEQKTAKDLRAASADLVKAGAAALYGSKYSQDLAQAGFEIRSQQGIHHAVEMAGKQYKVSEKAQEKREERDYNTFMDSSGHSNTHSADKGSKDAKAGGDHH